MLSRPLVLLAWDLTVSALLWTKCGFLHSPSWHKYEQIHDEKFLMNVTELDKKDEKHLDSKK